MTTEELKPNWLQSHRLAPTGKLKIVEARIVQNAHAIGPEILAEDELGVQWLLEYSNFVFDMTPHALTKPLNARYKIDYYSNERQQSTFYVDAVSFKDAVAKVEASSSFYHEKGLERWKLDLELVTEPTGAPITKEH